MNDCPYSRRIAETSRSNFRFSFYFLSRKKRIGMNVIYAFSRLVDDAVDEAPSEEKARQDLDIWKKRLHSCYQKDSSPDPAIFHPLLSELRETIDEFSIPQKYLSDLIVGCELDLTKKRYPSFEELDVYCYHVAGTIGLLCNRLFGMTGQKSEELAINLGKAFQLANIIRDVGDDAKRGRIYIPQQELAQFGVTEEEILSGQDSPRFQSLMRFQAERAQTYFHQFQGAYNSLPGKDKKKILPAKVMETFYYSLFQKIIRSGFPVLRYKVSLSGWEKFLSIFRVGFSQNR